MTTRERRRDDDRLRHAPGSDDPDAPDGSSLDAARAEGREFLRAGQDAIRRALSGDSLAFLRATRQHGGQ